MSYEDKIDPITQYILDESTFQQKRIAKKKVDKLQKNIMKLTQQRSMCQQSPDKAACLEKINNKIMAMKAKMDKLKRGWGV